MKLRRETLDKLLAVILPQYDKEPTDALATGYWLVLKDYEETDVQGAFFRHLSDPEHGSFRPKPADIIRQIEAVNGSGDDRLTEAWARLRDAIAEHGGDRSIQLLDENGDVDHAAHAAVMALGGWPALCETEAKEMPFRHKDFGAAYRAARTSTSGRRISHLSGRNERQNARWPQHIPKPVKVALAGIDRTERLPVIPVLPSFAPHPNAPDPKALQAAYETARERDGDEGGIVVLVRAMMATRKPEAGE